MTSGREYNLSKLSENAFLDINQSMNGTPYFIKENRYKNRMQIGRQQPTPSATKPLSPSSFQSTSDLLHPVSEAEVASVAIASCEPGPV